MLGFPGGTSGKEPACKCRRHKRCGLDPWLGRSPVGGHGNPLQHSCQENLVDRGAWWATVHRVAKSDMIEATLARMHTRTHNILLRLNICEQLLSIIIYIQTM